jgi:hypothetical protein
MGAAPPVAHSPRQPGPPRTPHPSPSFSAPTATVSGGPTTSFHLPAGTAAQFDDQDGTWTVALLGVEWIGDCDDVVGDSVPAVVFDIRYEVTAGAVSVVPLSDFWFILADGSRARVLVGTDCGDPPLDYTILTDKRHTLSGRIVVALPGGIHGVHGELNYGQLGPPTASWSVPALAE